MLELRMDLGAGETGAAFIQEEDHSIVPKHHPETTAAGRSDAMEVSIEVTFRRGLKTIGWCYVII